MTDIEWEGALLGLQAGRRPAELWSLALAAPPRWGACVLRLLAHHDWQPSAVADAKAYAGLSAWALACPDGPLPLGALIKRVRSLEGHSPSLLSLAVAQNSALFATGNDDYTVRLVSLPDGLPVATLRGHTEAVWAVAISPDGTLLASGGWDFSVRLWSLPDGRPLAALGAQTLIYTLAISPDGSLLASPGMRGEVQLWSLPDGRPLGILEGHSEFPKALAFSPDGSILASAAEGDLRIWSVPERRLVRIFEVKHTRTHALAFSPDGTLLASAGAYVLPGLPSMVRLWSPPEGHAVATLEGHRKAGAALVFTDGSCLASAGDDDTVRLWSVPDGRPLTTRLLDGSVRALALTPDRSRLCIAVGDAVQLWGSSLDRLWRSPLASGDADDLDWLEGVVQGDLTDGERKWAELILGLLRSRKRHELGGLDYATVAAGELDIEIGG